MNIKETNLNFGAMDKRKSTTRIFLHHSAADNQSVETIHNYHKSIGYAGIRLSFLCKKRW